MKKKRVKLISQKCWEKECQRNEGYDFVHVVKGDYAVSWPGIHHMLNVADRLVELGGELTVGELANYRSLYEQANEEEQALLAERFGGNLLFLNR